jgi:Replication protein
MPTLADPFDQSTSMLIDFHLSCGQIGIGQCLKRCEHRSPCGLPHCPRCEASKARRRHRRLDQGYASLWEIHPRLKPYLATLTTADVPISSLGSVLGELNKASAKTLGSTGSYGYYRQIEVVPAASANMLANVHAHAVLFLPQRRNITEEQVYSTWSESLQGATVCAGDARLEQPNHLESAFTYWTKQENLPKLLSEPSFFAAYSEQTAVRQLHYSHHLPSRSTVDEADAVIERLIGGGPWQ